MNTPEITELIHLVEKIYGKQLNTTTDFEHFSGYLHHNGYGTVSASTLKRMWGYVKDARKPRMNTLDILAAYVQHENFASFVAYLKTSTQYNSSFFSIQHISSADLPVNAEIELGWAPNRRLRLRYLGESLYEIIEANNSKLLAGDRFMAGCIFKEVPLYLPFILRNGEQTSPFIAGRNGGITCLNIIKNLSETSPRNEQ